jgi:hypothetical protein
VLFIGEVAEEIAGSRRTRAPLDTAPTQDLAETNSCVNQ